MPQIHVAYRSVELHVAFETISAVVGVLAAAFVIGRYAESGLLADALISSGLATLACTSLVGAVAAAARSERLGWSILVGSTTGALQLAVAAAAGTRRLRSPSGSLLAVALATAGYGAVVLALHSLDDRLPAWRRTVIGPGGSPHLSLSGPPAALAITSVATVLFAAATIGFAVSSRRRDGVFFGWLGAALALGTGARVNYLLFPSRESSWIFLGDVLRIACYLVLLAAVLLELREAQRRAATAQALDERRRLARELHDGLAQELAFLVQETRHASSDSLLAAAAQRALDESRRAIAVLAGPLDEPLAKTLERTAAQAAERAGLRLRLALDDGVAVDADARELLVRVVREAIDNAARHGHAAAVELGCSRDGFVRLYVADDGDGVGDDAATRGFALRRLERAAAALGGELVLRAAGPRGAVLEVAVP